jgi:hypothetical protein
MDKQKEHNCNCKELYEKIITIEKNINEIKKALINLDNKFIYEIQKLNYDSLDEYFT